MDKNPARKPRNILIDPEALHKARVEALCSKKTIGQWLEETIDERIKRGQDKAK